MTAHFALPCHAEPGRTRPDRAMPRPAVANSYLRKLERDCWGSDGAEFIWCRISLRRSRKVECKVLQRVIHGLVCQVVDFPRARMLEILIALGDFDECWKLHDRILQYARDNDIGLVQAYGRRGWVKGAVADGWKVKTTSYLYQREM